MGLWTELSQSMITTERKTYSILEWLGDVGGLFDGLLIIGSNLISPIAALVLRFTIFTNTRAVDAESGISFANFF